MVKARHHPLAAHRKVSLAAVFLLFSASLILLLVALSLPIIKPIYLLTVQAIVAGPATSTATELRFGVWGVCATSALNMPTAFTNHGDCSDKRLGYDVPPELFSVIGIPTAVGAAVLKGLLVVLVLHPIGAGLSFLTLIFALFLASHGLAIVALVLSVITALVTSLVLAIDLALVIVVKNKVKDLGVAFEVRFGPAVWMVVAAVALTWIAMILLSARACYCCGLRRKSHYPHSRGASAKEVAANDREVSSTDSLEMRHRPSGSDRTVV